jgi:uncharacterized protein DUF4412
VAGKKLMKPSSVAAVALLVICVPCLAQTEGIAEFKGSTVASGKTITSSGRVYLAKNAYRMEWEIDVKNGAAPTGGRIVIIQKLSDPDHIVNIDDARKIYSITDLKEFREASPEERRETYTVRKTGSDTVGGYPCEKALVTSSGGTRSEICVCSELYPSSAFLALQSRRDRSNKLVEALRAKGLDALPIRFVMRTKGSVQPLSTMELVRFEKKPVAPSLFEVPKGYTRASDTPATMAPEQKKTKVAAPPVQKPPAKQP